MPENVREPTDLIPHGTPSGYSYHGCRCDLCKSSEAERGRQYRKANLDKETERNRRYREANPVDPEKIAERNRRRYDADPEYFINRVRKYRADNPEKIAERNRKYHDANREKIAERNRRRREANPAESKRIRQINDDRRRTRKRDAFVEDVPREEIFERDGWHCQIPGCLYPGIPVSLDVPCLDPTYASIDHIIPLAKGGLHERSNLACAHLRCNIVKNDNTEGGP